MTCCVLALSACGDDQTGALESDDGGDPARVPDGGMAASRTSSLDASVMLDAMSHMGPGDAGDAALAADASVDPSAALFDESALLEVQITLSDADWNTLRQEGRDIVDNFDGCLSQDFAYTKMHASAVIAGQTFADVAVRKKGFLGSISVRKPSLRIELDEYVAGQTLLGSKTLILNNSLTDASYVHQCMAYAQFRAAGIAAPRCSFARVTVNGQLMGIFTNVEPIKKPMLRRHFPDDSGNLYEGSSPADFRSDMLGNFEKKTNDADPSKPELEALAALLLESDDALLAGLDALIDTDEFFRFWAVESLIADWDSYSSDLNNIYLYADPQSHKLSFIPWGPDDAYDRNPPLLARPVGTPQSVYATARLPRRLYQIASTRERFRQALREQLAQHWDETALLAEIDRMASVIGTAANATSLELQRDFVRTRRAELQAELDAPAVDWPLPERAVRTCAPQNVIAISGSFDTTWQSLASAAPSIGNTLSLAGVSQPALLGLGGAGDALPPYQDADRLSALSDSLITLSIVRPDTTLFVLQLQIGQSPLMSGTITSHGFETFGVLLAGADAMSLSIVGFVGKASIVLSEASATTGAPVAGNFTGEVALLAPVPELFMAAP